MNVPAELLQQIADYLITRPWGEVNALMVGLYEANKLAISAPPPDNTQD